MAEETADIYRMNKLLEIEHSDWERQLKQAVSFPFFFLTPFPQSKFILSITYGAYFLSRALKTRRSVSLKRVAFCISMRNERGSLLPGKS